MMRVFALALTVTVVAGAHCDMYCAYMADACDSTFADEAACLAECTRFPEVDSQTGNTLACREYHASVANTSDGATRDAHCGHANPISTANCVDAGMTGMCQNYCDNLFDTCNATTAAGGWDESASTRMACNAACANVPDLGGGAVNTFPLAAPATGNSIECRRYHLQVARGDADTHCPHASPWGGSQCGTLCEAYCDQMMAGCSGEFDNRTACDTACAAYPTTGAFGDADGDTFQCRFYHLLVAMETDPVSTVHCGHAAEDGGGVCIAAPPDSPANRASAGVSGMIAVLALLVAKH